MDNDELIMVSDKVLSFFTPGIPQQVITIIRTNFNDPSEQHLSSQYGEVRKFLAGWGYIEQASALPTDKITDEGKLVNKIGGHIKYQEWKEKEKRRKNFEDIPRRWWHIYEPVKLVVVIVATVLLTLFIKECIDRLRTPKQQKVKEIKPNRSSPTISNKKDTSL